MTVNCPLSFPLHLHGSATQRVAQFDTTPGYYQFIEKRIIVRLVRDVVMSKSWCYHE